MQTDLKRSSFLHWELLPVIFALAWPTMLENLMNTAVQYIDTAMVGSLGTQATAAVGSTVTVNWLVGSSVSALGVGFLAYISQSIGAGNPGKAKRASAQAVLVAVIIGCLFTLATTLLSPYVPVWMHVDPAVKDLASRYFLILYLPMLPRACSIIFGTVLRAAGDTRTPMRAGILVNLVNVVLNYLFIYPTRMIRLFGLQIRMIGAGWGVIGAAAASAIAFTLGGIALTAALWRHEQVSPKGERMLPDGEILRPCLRVALPNMLQRFCTSLGYVVFASMINSLGQLSTAAHTIANTVESAFYIPGYGMMSAAATLTGNCIGAGDEDRRKNMARMIMLSEFTMMCVSGGLLILFAKPLSGIFTKDPGVIELSSRVLRMVACSEPLYGISIVTEGMLQGAGETLRPFAFGAGSMWGVRILGTFIFVTVLGFGLVSAWAAMIAGNMVLMLMLVIYYRSGRWKRRVGLS